MKNVKTGNYPHFGITAREGIHILYRYPNTKNWFNVDAISSRNSPISINMNHIIRKNEEYEILIYGPLLCEVSELKIETPKKSKIEYFKNKKNRTFMIVGGIHSFGIGCTACGVMFSNILGRKFDSNIQNLSFNNKDYLKNSYEYFNKNKHEKVDLAIMEIDYIRQNNKIFDKYIEKVIKQVKSKADYLICWYSLPKTEIEKHEKIKKLMKKYSKDSEIIFLDLSFIYDEKYSEMCTHSKNYINDTGNIMIYKKLEETIQKIDFSKKEGKKHGIFKINK